MSTEERRVIEDCFERGTVGEDCDDCLAHPDNDPEDPCCYGSQHEYHDKQCRRCPFETACARLTHGRSTSVKTGSRLKLSHIQRKVEPVSQPKPLIQPATSSSVLINRTLNKDIQEECKESPEATFLKRLGKATGWGMIEGGLQMALDHFQRNRPK